MDSRDVKAEPEINSGYLESMYDMQKFLIDHYIGIEGLPQYPIDVNTKSSQVLLKDFTSRITEELAESFEAYLEVVNLTNANMQWSAPAQNIKAYLAMINHLQNVGEEYADALHFFLELLIYANIQPEDIVSYIDSNPIYNDQRIGVERSKDNLAYIANSGAIKLIEKYCLDTELREQHNIRLTQHLDNDWVKSIIDKRFLACNDLYNWQFTPFLKEILWDITYHLNISRNFLKNKPWKQSSVMTQESQYQEQLVIAFIDLMGLMQISGCDPATIYFLYFKKNHVNQFRIKSKY